LLVLLAALWGAAGAGSAAAAEGIDVRSAQLVLREDGYALQADLEITLTPTLEDALNRGVSLFFMLEFELIRPRWYWLNEKVLSIQQQYRLSFNTLTRQYRVSSGTLYQNFSSLAEALAFLSRIRRSQVMDAAAVRGDTSYAAALRMRLDLSELPKPFQVNALASREWNIGSDWYRWSFSVAP
jgi:uncharacterized membrane protein SirB2